MHCYAQRNKSRFFQPQIMDSKDELVCHKNGLAQKKESKEIKIKANYIARDNEIMLVGFV